MFTEPLSSCRCEPNKGIASCDRLVEQIMKQPYSADRLFLIVDNGSYHRGQNACHRLNLRWPNIVLVHLPVHASWLNQIEIYSSIIQRKVLTPNAFSSLGELEEYLFAFQARYDQIASPFWWTFTRKDLSNLMKKLENTSQLKAASLRGHFQYVTVVVV